MSNVIEITDADHLARILEDNRVVVVDFSQEASCVPCRRLKPHFDSVAAQIPDIKFVKVDIDKFPDLAKFFDIQTVPTIVKFTNIDNATIIKGRTAIQLLNELAVV